MNFLVAFQVENKDKQIYEHFMTGLVNMKKRHFEVYSVFFGLSKGCANEAMTLGEARALGEQEDVVRIMTIHSSKGLEFPVVFVVVSGDNSI